MTTEKTDHTNWVDPDILEYEVPGASFDYDMEREFKEFFETGWLDSKYDHLRERWNPLITDESAHCRVLGKTALWSLVRLLELKESDQNAH